MFREFKSGPEISCADPTVVSDDLWMMEVISEKGYENKLQKYTIILSVSQIRTSLTMHCCLVSGLSQISLRLSHSNKCYWLQKGSKLTTKKANLVWKVTTIFWMFNLFVKIHSVAVTHVCRQGHPILSLGSIQFISVTCIKYFSQ